ncbi:hypothetical protein [uncultured Sphaerochaeta sp.]|uniref:hypothetical protein n=1 Tax=uncultured Sphaerochaeta sp. TaxID=886478 RepID=UPI002619051C|nr:hypothetical protein [uncultured Sphaerochaeta sp.]
MSFFDPRKTSFIGGGGGGGGGLTGSGVANKVAYWSGASALTYNTNFSYDGTDLTVDNGSVKTDQIWVNAAASAQVGSAISPTVVNNSSLATGVLVGTNVESDFAGMRGVGIGPQIKPAAAVGTVYGILNLPVLRQASDLSSYDVTNWHANFMRGDLGFDYSGTVTNMRVVQVDNPAIIGGGAITNAFGVHIGSITSGSTANYALYTNSGEISLGGDVRLRGGADLLMVGATSGTITVSAPAVAGTNTITWPASTGTVALLSDIPSLSGYVNTSGSPASTHLATFSGSSTITGTSSLVWASSVLTNSGEYLGRYLNINDTGAARSSIVGSVISPKIVDTGATANTRGLVIAPDVEHNYTGSNGRIVEISPIYRPVAFQNNGVIVRVDGNVGQQSGGGAVGIGSLSVISARLSRLSPHTGAVNTGIGVRIEQPNGFTFGSLAYYMGLYIESTTAAVVNYSLFTNGTGLSSFGGDIEMRGSTSGAILLKATAVAGSNTITFPAATGTVALRDGTSVTGSRGGNAALASLLTALAASGLIVDNTTA